MNSGLAWSVTILCMYLYRLVLIPLNSGLAWSEAVRPCGAMPKRLNPFEFRAGLEPFEFIPFAIPLAS